MDEHHGPMIYGAGDMGTKQQLFQNIFTLFSCFPIENGTENDILVN